MIKNWVLKNFKSVKGLKKLDFAPLTIFAGANSSGKSTILQSILLTTQTLQNSVTNKSIILNGHISKFGTFNDILSNGSNERSITLGFEIEPLLTEDDENDFVTYPRYFFRHSEELSNIFCEFSFSDHIKGVTNEIYQLQPRLEKSRIKAQTKDSLRTSEIEIERSSKTIEERVKELDLNESQVVRNDLQSLEFEVKKPLYSIDDTPHTYIHSNVEGKYVGAYLSHFLPRFLSILYNKNEEEKKQFWQILRNQEQSQNIDEIFNKFINKNIIDRILQLFQEINDEIKSGVRKGVDQFRADQIIVGLEKNFDYMSYKNAFRTPILGRGLFQKLEENKDQIMSLVRKDFKADNRLTTTFGYFDYSEFLEFFFKRSLKYLGPLRDEPKPIYPLIGSSDPKDIGFKGENTAAVLEVNKNVVIKYIQPEYFINKLAGEVTKQDTLINAVLDWLDYMGIAKKVDTADKGKLGHELRILTPGANSLHDLTHVGVGVSQVLPILVLSLLSEIDSTLIFEQPELHLNPKVQTRLADFFFSMTILKKQCIVETHSEYLINRLRYQVAQSKDDSISKNILMYFVEKENESSNYKQVSINKYGVIEDWPKGFFDENEETAAAILRAAMEKRKIEKK